MFPKRFSSLPPFLCKSRWHECFTCWASSPVGPLTHYRSVSTLLGLTFKGLQVLITTYFFHLPFIHASLQSIYCGGSYTQSHPESWLTHRFHRFWGPTPGVSKSVGLGAEAQDFVILTSSQVFMNQIKACVRSPHSYMEALTCNVTIFGDGTSKEVIKFKWGQKSGVRTQQD